jgi:hypothetical protein
LTVNYGTNWNMDCRRVLRGFTAGQQRGRVGGDARGEGWWGLEVGGCIEGVLEEG